MGGRRQGEGREGGRVGGSHRQLPNKQRIVYLVIWGKTKRRRKKCEVLIESVILNWEEKILSLIFLAEPLGQQIRAQCWLVAVLIFNFCLNTWARDKGQDSSTEWFCYLSLKHRTWIRRSLLTQVIMNWSQLIWELRPLPSWPLQCLEFSTEPWAGGEHRHGPRLGSCFPLLLGIPGCLRDSGFSTHVSRLLYPVP